MNLKFLLIFLLVITTAKSQQTLILKNSKPFPATEEYTFICEKYAYTGELKVQTAKTEKGGILKLSISVPNDKLKISGGVYVDLINGDVIACVDKSNNETMDSKTTSYFYFTPAEFLKLKKTDIYAIRFIISGTSNRFGNQTGHFTAVNRKKYFSTTLDESKQIFDTAVAISNL